jgi:hypothetical protein
MSLECHNNMIISMHKGEDFFAVKRQSEHRGGAKKKKQSHLTATLSDSQNRLQSYDRGTTLAACKPLGPSSTENSTFCSASNLR